ncbi:hypothetical protein, partial [Muricomes intestini]|uniref:hypothetical protein n=1 Tax=Muricomes intestini TaxID=1796634 RepID=UPI002FDE197F
PQSLQTKVLSVYIIIPQNINYAKRVALQLLYARYDIMSIFLISHRASSSRLQAQAHHANTVTRRIKAGEINFYARC